MNHGFEIWASPEPTVARVAGAEYRDQLAETGHDRRDGDIDLLAGLGVAATRYPVLWEKTAPVDPTVVDLSWARRRLERLRERGVDPVVTLLHHGSGPPYTSLVDPAFPELFAGYAESVARAFPWVRRWTPINEPLTTARFSTLYGHWHPCGRDDHAAFGAAICQQALAMLLAIAAVRRHIPAAQFVLTEDLQGFTARDSSLAAYARHKHERSFLSIELVMGRVVPGHPLFVYLTDACNVERSVLRRIAERASAPQVIGWNYYPNSERTLDRGVDGSIVNLATVRERESGISPLPLLRAAYDRLGLPFGISEVHINADAAGRRRWLAQRYADLVQLERAGLPVRMLGAWAAFGLIDWDSLLTRREGYREDGVFTFAAAGAVPRATLVSEAVAELARGDSLVVSDEPGWWERRGEPVRAVRA